MTRMFCAQDAEPTDRPFLRDDQDCVWWYDPTGDDETGVWPGWYSPHHVTATCTWRDIWTEYGAVTLTEITGVEADILDAEVGTWFLNRPERDDC